MFSLKYRFQKVKFIFDLNLGFFDIIWIWKVLYRVPQSNGQFMKFKSIQKNANPLNDPEIRKITCMNSFFMINLIRFKAI